jgi:hypothetical protein
MLRKNYYQRAYTKPVSTVLEYISKIERLIWIEQVIQSKNNFELTFLQIKYYTIKRLQNSSHNVIK